MRVRESSQDARAKLLKHLVIVGAIARRIADARQIRFRRSPTTTCERSVSSNESSSLRDSLSHLNGDTYRYAYPFARALITHTRAKM